MLLIIVVCLLKGMCIPSFVLIVCCVNELLGHLCPYRDVWPEAVYCCITRTTLFTELFTYLEVDITSPSFVALLLLVSEIAKCILPEAIYCLIVLQELHCLSNCLHVCMIRVRHLPCCNCEGRGRIQKDAKLK